MPGRAYVKGKMKKQFRSIKDMIDASNFVDAGELEIVASTKDIPQGDQRGEPFASQERKFGCLPWRLLVHRIVDTRKQSGPTAESPREPRITTTNYLKVTLECAYKEPHSNWTAKASGVLRMEKWPEKVKGKGEFEKLSEYEERFTRKFNNNVRQHKFMQKFPIPMRSRSFSDATDSPYLKNGQFKFRMEIVIHNVRKVHFPYYDFQKNTPMCNAIVKIVDSQGQTHRYNVNKEYLSMHSEALEAMFTNPNFIEGRTSEVELKQIAPPVFNEFLCLIYPSRQRPHVRFLKGLLDFARCFFIPMVTAVCEQRLLTTEEAEMSVADRLKLADEYGLFQVKSDIMQHLDYKKLDSFIKNLDGLTQETLQMLLRKQTFLKENEDRRKEAQLDEPMEVEKQATSSSSRRGAGSSGTTHGRGTGGGHRRTGGGTGRRH